MSGLVRSPIGFQWEDTPVPLEMQGVTR